MNMPITSTVASSAMSLDVISMPQRIYDALQQAANPSKTALIVNKESFSYHALRNLVFGLANYLKTVTGNDAQESRIAILARQDLCVYQSILSCIVSGITYVPLTTTFPAEKNAHIIKHSEANYLIVSPQQLDYAINMLREHFTADELARIKIVCDHATVEQLLQEQANFSAAQHSQLQANLLEIASFTNITGHDLMAQDYLEPFDFIAVPFAEPSSTESQGQKLLHILYTSGTTGQPKGVMISQRNYANYFAKILGLYQFQSNDVFSHFAEMTFDISLQDPLSALCCGGTVACPNNFDRLNPLKYIARNNITVVHTVPSLISYLERVHLTDSAPIESVRLGIFIGEALYYKSLCTFTRLFPHSRLINTYGPTETTVAVSYFEVDPSSLKTSQVTESKALAVINNIQVEASANIANVDKAATRAIVPLGKPFTDVSMAVMNNDGQCLAEGEIGELVLGGIQVTCGYYHNEVKTAAAFFTKDDQRYYRTGDMVYWQANPSTHDPVFYYVGRGDDMIKFHGYRLSFYEIDEKLSELTSHAVRTLAYTDNTTHDTILVAAVEGASSAEIEKMQQQASKHLAFYMQPSCILSCESFPLNVNGKVDRNALHKQMQPQVSSLLGLNS